ncbi:MAG TPA: phosphopantetheine-binding protein [Longimicrobiales bacterium]|nr:phosphopantetheine-binding protein [Longimicrobiales bacterium]
MTRDAFVTATVRWINARLVPAGVVVAADTPLFETGLIDSIRILQLIAWTEQATGRRIPDEHIRMDYFRDVSTIAARFAEVAA